MVPAMQALLDQPTGATHDAAIAAGPWPVLFYAPSFHDSPNENALIFELLASHGFVVVSSPSMGGTSRAMGGSILDMEAQVRDLEFIKAWAMSELPIDPQRIGVGGFSWGGMANVLFAARHPEVGAVLTLDGTRGYSHDDFKTYMADLLPPWKVESMRGDFLSLRRSSNFQGDADSTTTYAHLNYSNKIFVRHEKSNHLSYSSREVLNRAYLRPSVTAERRDRAGSLLAEIAVTSLHFLEYSLNGDSAAGEALMALSSSVHVSALNHEPGAPVPPSETEFVAMMVDGDYDKFAETIEPFLAQGDESLVGAELLNSHFKNLMQEIGRAHV